MQVKKVCKQNNILFVGDPGLYAALRKFLYYYTNKHADCNFYIAKEGTYSKQEGCKIVGTYYIFVPKFY